jgi:hypothetical protein
LFFLMGRWTFKTPFEASLTTMVMIRVEVREGAQYGKTQLKECDPSGTPVPAQGLALRQQLRMRRCQVDNARISIKLGIWGG